MYSSRKTAQGTPSPSESSPVVRRQIDHRPTQVGTRLVELGQSSATQHLGDGLLQQIVGINLDGTHHCSEPSQRPVQIGEEPCLLIQL